jgi:hypothetical protein
MGTRKLLTLATLIIVFISVTTAMATLSTLIVKYNTCREHLFSQTELCDLTEIGKTLNSGMMLIGFMAVIASGAIYILMGLITKSGGRSYAEFKS